MRGFILAAGFGTRLRPLTDHIPKALVPVGGLPLLSRSLQFFKNNGISNIGVNAHYLPDQLSKYQQNSDIQFSLFVEDGSIRGTGGAFHFARDFLNSEETFCVVNVDILNEFDLKPLITEFERSERICTLLAFPAIGKGTIIYNESNSAYLGTVADQNALNTGIECDFIGVAFYRRKFLDLITPEDFSIVPVWSRARQSGFNVGVRVIEQGYWRDIGTPESLAAVHFDLLDGKLRINIPGNLKIDFENRRCFHVSLSPEKISKLGPYTWFEPENVYVESDFSRSVVFRDAKIDGKAMVHDSILTPWGVIPLK